MRTFCLALILANALYFIWSHLIDVKVSSLDRAQVTTATPPPRIVLAREAASVNTPEAPPADNDVPVRDVQPPSVEPLHPAGASPGSAEVARTDPLTCTTIGPFAELAQAAQAQASLRGAGFEPRQRVEEGELWVGYWVSVQGLPSRDAAEDALKTLNANAITDVYLMPGSDPANVLSLGVFSDYQRAQRRAEEVRALGLQPRIDDRKRAGSVYWIDVDLPEPGKPIDSSIFETGPGKILRLEMRACPAAASG
jgi:hypothetical protein